MKFQLPAAACEFPYVLLCQFDFGTEALCQRAPLACPVDVNEIYRLGRRFVGRHGADHRPFVPAPIDIDDEMLNDLKASMTGNPFVKTDEFTDYPDDEF